MKLIILIAAILIISACDNSERWPEHKVSDDFRAQAKLNAHTYKEQGINADSRSQDYSTSGDYLNYGTTVRHRAGEKIKLDEDGVPLVLQSGKFHYSPVTVAIAALAEHGRFLKTNSSGKFIAGANRLLSLMGEDGAFRYPYTYRHYTSLQSLAPGWTSGMSQGMALSVFARAYILTKEDKWLHAGDKTLAFLETPFPDGPKSNLEDLDVTLKGRAFYLEYPAEPNAYTLNGYMFALIGLYDWMQVSSSKIASNAFSEGISTLERILPYYDFEHFSAYDLTYVTYSKVPFLLPRKAYFATRYHAVHITQLRALASVTGNETLSATAEKWAGYVAK